MPYETTAVPVAKSQEQIRGLLRLHGATGFAFAEGTDEVGAWASVQFVHSDQMIRMRVPLRPADPDEIEAKGRRSRTKTASEIAAEWSEQEAKRIWRVLHWSIKARLEAVSEGVETLEQAFLAHMVDPASNQTVWQAMEFAINAGALRLGGTGLRSLSAGVTI